MSPVRSILLMALLAAPTTGAALGEDGQLDLESGFVTRVWTWTTGTSITTFTAYGPVEQVTAFDPRDSVATCKGCLLASSIQPGSVPEAMPTDAEAEPIADR